MEVWVPQRSLAFLCLLFLGLSHLMTATTGQSEGCSRGFDTFSLSSGDDDDDDDDSREIHYVVPYMNFSCDGTIDKIEFAASHAEEARGTVEFEVWRPSASSSGIVTLYELITDAPYSGSFDDGGYRTGTISPSFTVSSGDVLGIFVRNSRSLNVGTTSRSDDDFLVYRLKDGSGTATTANIPSSYDSSSNFSPLVTVSFVPYPTESSDLTTEAAISSTSTEVSSSSNPSSSTEVSSSSNPSSSTEVSSSTNPSSSTEVSSSSNPSSSTEVSSSTNPSSSTEVSSSANPSSSSNPSSSTEVSSSSNPSSSTEVSSSSNPSSSTEVSSSSNPSSSTEVSSSTNPSSSTDLSSSTNPSSSTEVSLVAIPSSSTKVSSSANPSASTEVSSSVASTSTTGKDSSTSSSTSVHNSVVPGTDDEVLGNLESGDSNVGVIVGAVLGGTVLVVIAIVLVGAVVFLLYPRANKEKQYITFARFRRDTAHVQLVRMRRPNITSTVTLDSLALAEYDDPDAYIQTLPHGEPHLVTAPPLPPSNDAKEVYETVQQQQDDGSLVVVNPGANTSGYEVVVRQEDPVSGVVLTADGPSTSYDTITDGGQPLQVIYESIETQYHYVPNENARKQGTLTRPSSGLEDELRSIYGGVTKPEYEGQPFVSPGKELNTIYGQLADKKCIEIPRSFLKKETVLGTGEFGDVFKGVWDTPYGPQDVAIKMLKVGSKEKDIVNFLKEAALMGQFRHPNVIRLLGAVTVDDPCIIVLEFLPRGDLEKHLHSQQPEPGVLPEAMLPSQLLQFCRDIADGMKYLSNKGFVHRDLAARNILLDKNLKCKIADFGLSKTLQSDSEYYIAKGGRVPVRWTPPEALFYKKYTTSSDVWSYGMVVFEIWSLGEKPFRDIEAMNVVKILRNNESYVQAPPPGCPRDMYRLMVYCWDRNHHNRPDFNAIHSVLRGPADSLLKIPNDDLQQTKDPLKAGQLGMPLEFGEDLYTDLQRYYNADNA